MADIGILASLDPVALDQACVDLVFNYPSSEGDNASALIERINSRHGVHTIEHAAKIGLGRRDYQLIQIDGEDMLRTLNENGLSLLVRNHGKTTSYNHKGVHDLLQLIDEQPQVLKGAVVADKLIGKAAAAIMVVAGVKEVHTNLICTSALKMLREAGVKVFFKEEVPMILNRSMSGQCPIDSQVDTIMCPQKCVEILRQMPKME